MRSELDAATTARLEGCEVELRAARDCFMDAAASTIQNMQDGIIRSYPEFYSNEERALAGLSRRWCHPLYPVESLSWRCYALSAAQVVFRRSYRAARARGLSPVAALREAKG